jgi:hypothetical protein
MRPRGSTRTYTWTVLVLLGASTALVLYDGYVLLTYALRG